MAPPFVRGPHPRGHHHLTNNNNNNNNNSPYSHPHSHSHPRSPPQSLSSSSSSSGARQGRQFAVLAVLVVLGCVVMPQHTCDAWRILGNLNATLYSIPSAIKKADFGQPNWDKTYVVTNIGDMDSDSVDDLALSEMFTGTVVVVSWSVDTAGVKRYGTITRPAAWAAGVGTDFGWASYPLRYDYNGDGANDLLVSAGAGFQSSSKSFSNGRLVIYSVLPSGGSAFNTAVLKAYTPSEWCTGLDCQLSGTQFGHHVLSYQRYGRFCITVPSGHNKANTQWPTQCGITSTVPFASSGGTFFTASYLEQPGATNQNQFENRKHIIVLGDANDDGNEELLKLCEDMGWKVTVMFEDKINWDVSVFSSFDSSVILGAPGDVNADGVPDYAIVTTNNIWFMSVYCKYDPDGQFGQYWLCGQSEWGTVPMDTHTPMVGLPQAITIQGAFAFSRRQSLSSLVMWYTPDYMNGANTGSLTRLDLGRGVGWNTDTPDCKYHSYVSDVNPWTQWNVFGVGTSSGNSNIDGKVEGRVGTTGGIALRGKQTGVSRVAPDPSGRGPKFPATLVSDGEGEQYFVGRLVWGISAVGTVDCGGNVLFGGIESSTQVIGYTDCVVEGYLKSTAVLNDYGATSWGLLETTKATTLSYDLAKVAAYYIQRSIDYSLMPDTKLANGANIYTTQTTDGGTKTILTVALNARVNVINGTDILTNIKKIVLNGPGTGVLIINVAGTSTIFLSGIEVVDSDGNALKYGRVLINCHGAGMMIIQDSPTPSVLSVLAPKATIYMNSGKWAGNYVGVLVHVGASVEVQNVPFGSFVRPTVGWTKYSYSSCEGSVNTFTPGVAVASKWLCAWGAW